MKITDKMPESGQFIAVWEYNGLSWSSTHKFQGLTLMRRNDGPDLLPPNLKWFNSDDDRDFYENNGAKFIVMGE